MLNPINECATCTTAHSKGSAVPKILAINKNPLNIPKEEEKRKRRSPKTIKHSSASSFKCRFQKFISDDTVSRYERFDDLSNKQAPSYLLEKLTSNNPYTPRDFRTYVSHRYTHIDAVVFPNSGSKGQLKGVTGFKINLEDKIFNKNTEIPKKHEAPIFVKRKGVIRL